MIQHPSVSTQNLSKEALRTQLFELRGRVGDAVRAAAPLALVRHFFDSIEVRPGQMVSGFFPIGSEIDPLPLLAELRARGAKTCLPVVVGRGEPLIFRLFTGAENLVPVGFGCQAPGPEAGDVVPDILLIPLLGIDLIGHRLGYGGGYYDRTLASYSHQPRRIGVAFSCQEVDVLPAEPHDMKLELLLSETGLKDLTL